MAGTNKDVNLAKCVVSYDATATAPGANSYTVIPRVTAIGAIGSQSEKKEKTVLSDDRKRYGNGLKDAEDKELKGQYVPFNDTGETYEADYTAQQTFFGHVKNEQEMMIKIEWPDGETDEFLFQPLGFYKDEPNQEEWKMWTVPGTQNSDVTTTAPTGS
jgi:hypothetical protein